MLVQHIQGTGKAKVHHVVVQEYMDPLGLMASGGHGSKSCPLRLYTILMQSSLKECDHGSCLNL